MDILIQKGTPTKYKSIFTAVIKLPDNYKLFVHDYATGKNVEQDQLLIVNKDAVCSISRR